MTYKEFIEKPNIFADAVFGDWYCTNNGISAIYCGFETDGENCGKAKVLLQGDSTVTYYFRDGKLYDSIDSEYDISPVKTIVVHKNRAEIHTLKKKLYLENVTEGFDKCLCNLMECIYDTGYMYGKQIHVAN